MCDSEQKTEFPDQLPPIIKDTMVMELNDQVKITLFPEMEPGQPIVDIIKVDLTEIEGKTRSLCLTPDEAAELAGGLAAAVQMYLFNQEQYRKEILEPRLKIAKERAGIEDVDPSAE